MKRTFATVAFLALVFLMPMAGASGITRSLSKSSAYPGETVSVTLDVAVTGGESYYLIDEKVPSGWAIVNPDPQTESGHVKWVVFQGAASTSYTYQVVAPQLGGTYAFSGNYMFEGMTAEGSIGGQNAITVQAAAPASSGIGYGDLIAPAIVLAGVLITIFIYMLKSRKKAKKRRW